MEREEEARVLGVLGNYAFDAVSVRGLDGGLINKTYLVQSRQGQFVLQSLHPIFKANVHDDIEAVTAHLARKGLVTPRLVRTKDGKLCVEDGPEAMVFRVLSFVPGRSYATVQSTAHAYAAGELVARFHAATNDLEHEFQHVRAGVHDTAAHMAKLQAALQGGRAHRYYDALAPMAEAILASVAALPKVDPRTARVTHGDLKISNLMFDTPERGVCLVDLDTMGRMPLAHELGDAWRSWCNPRGEDSEDVRFDLDIFAAAARGYFSIAAPFTSRAQLASLADAAETIALELAARFCADAFLEVYFGWNPNKYPDRATHNRVRAAGQLALAKSARKAHAQIEAALQSAYEGAS